MALIYETEDFKLESVDKPLIDCLEGAHLQISLKSETTKLSAELQAKLTKFITLVSEAVKFGRRKRGLDIGRIDFQEKGGKKPKLPVQMYCRARGATMQKYSEPIVPKHKAEYKPLDEEDIRILAKEVKKLVKKEKALQDSINGKSKFPGKFQGINRAGLSMGQKPPARHEHRQRA